jgi:hypothetical protein
MYITDKIYFAMQVANVESIASDPNFEFQIVLHTGHKQTQENLERWAYDTLRDSVADMQRAMTALKRRGNV